MAEDPQARENSSSAMIIAIVALVVVVVAAVGFMMSRNAESPDVAAPPTIIDNRTAPDSEVIPVPVPSTPDAPDITINPPDSSSSSSTTTTTESGTSEDAGIAE